MKNLIVTLLLAITAITASAQSGASFFKTWSDTNDTLGAYSTFTYDFNTTLFAGQNISKVWTYDIVVEADSLSGAAADSSTVFLQVSNSSVSDASPLWYTVSTDQIDGTATQVFRYTGDITAPRMRLVISSQSGTKAIALRSYGAFKVKHKI